jgi:hypothetical protein
MLTGWYGLRAEPGSDAGFRLYRFGGLIASAEFFGHPVPAQAPNLGRLIGEMEVPRVQLTMNKSDFDRDSEPWVEIDQRMHLLITPVVRRLVRGGQQRPTSFPASKRIAAAARPAKSRRHCRWKSRRRLTRLPRVTPGPPGRRRRPQELVPRGAAASARS